MELEKFKVYKDCIKWIGLMTELEYKLPKNHRFGIFAKVLNESIELTVDLSNVASCYMASDKLVHIDKMKDRIARIHTVLRVLNHCCALKDEYYKQYCVELEEIHSQVKAWKNKLSVK